MKRITVNIPFKEGMMIDVRDNISIDQIGKTVFIAAPELEVSDGYHTMDELYDHRIELFITLCRKCIDINAEGGMDVNNDVWRSKFHSDDSSFDGWFILGIGKETKSQISYHIPMSRWDDTGFAETLDRAPEWDGHSSADVLQRLKKL